MVEAVPVYAVNPDRVTIAAKSSCQLEFFGFSAQPGQIEERFVCTFGSGAKSKQIVFDMLARFDTHLLAADFLSLCTADMHPLVENPGTACTLETVPWPSGVSLQLYLCTDSIQSITGKLISRSGKLMWSVCFRANIAPPMLQFSERKLDWCHSYTPGQAAVPMTRPLTVQNISPLSFPCSLRTSPPFSVDQTSFQLAPQETVTVTVTFDPAQK